MNTSLRKYILAFGFIISTLFSIAQPVVEKTLLWEITGNGLKEPSYLYGTIHLMCPQDLQVNEVIKQKFNATKELFLEVKTDDPGMMMEMLSGIQMKDTSTLKGMIGNASFDSLSTVFKANTGIPLELLNKTKPILVVAMVYPTLLGCTPDSWEKQFELMAKERSMPLKGLEKLSDQMEVLESIPYKSQAEMLLKIMSNLDSAKSQFNLMLNIYKSKDVQALYDMTTADEDFGMYEATMLVQRNKNWIPIIKSQTVTTPTFIAVGAAHLPGNNGVINLLRREGFTVKPVMY